MKDIELIESLKKGGVDKENVGEFMFEEYKEFIPVIKQKLGLNQHEIQEVYVDSIIKFLRELSAGRIQQEKKLSIHFNSIFYNNGVEVMRKKASKEIKDAQLYKFDLLEQGLLDLIRTNASENHVIMVMDQMGKSCTKVLVDWSYHRFSMKEIASRSTLRHSEIATSMQRKCIKILRDLLADKLFQK